jgi:hypothetical protein
MKISDIITPVNTQYGAPMGRYNVGSQPITIIRGNNGRICKSDQTKVYEKRVPLIDGYDKGGAYWGLPNNNLRVRFTKDLQYVEYFRA